MAEGARPPARQRGGGGAARQHPDTIQRSMSTDGGLSRSASVPHRGRGRTRDRPDRADAAQPVGESLPRHARFRREQRGGARLEQRERRHDQQRRRPFALRLEAPAERDRPEDAVGDDDGLARSVALPQRRDHAVPFLLVRSSIRTGSAKRRRQRSRKAASTSAASRMNGRDTAAPIPERATPDETDAFRKSLGTTLGRPGRPGQGAASHPRRAPRRAQRRGKPRPISASFSRSRPFSARSVPRRAMTRFVQVSSAISLRRENSAMRGS